MVCIINADRKALVCETTIIDIVAWGGVKANLFNIRQKNKMLSMVICIPLDMYVHSKSLPLGMAQ